MIPIEDVVFLSHYTSSGISEILEFEEWFFDKCLESAVKLYELEQKAPMNVVILGYSKGDE